MSIAAPKSDMETALQHWFSESRWSQHSDTALKVHGLFRAIKLLFWVRPTEYIFLFLEWCHYLRQGVLVPQGGDSGGKPTGGQHFEKKFTPKKYLETNSTP